MKKNLALVAGGFSSEYIVSVKSAESVFTWIDQNKFNVFLVIIKKNEWYASFPDREKIPVNRADFSIQYENKTIHFDFAYIIIHGTPGEDGKLQGYLDILGIPYSTCGVLAASLTFNKFFTKSYLARFGIISAEGIFLRKGDKFDAESVLKKLGTPCFVKPNKGGSSFGISKITGVAELIEAIDKAGDEDEEIIIESYLEGTELTCGLVKIGEEIIVFPVTEVISKNEFFDFEAKYTKGMAEEITPARISAELKKECSDLSAFIYKTLDCEGIVRIDYIHCKGKLFLLEVNAIPGMTETSFIPQQIRAMGKNVQDIINPLIESILRKHLQ
jgi:D-alanine-D-alanine ligase